MACFWRPDRKRLDNDSFAPIQICQFFFEETSNVLRLEERISQCHDEFTHNLTGPYHHERDSVSMEKVQQSKIPGGVVVELEIGFIFQPWFLW